MSDLLKGFSGGGWAGLVAWSFPSAIGIAVVWFFIYLQLHHPPLAPELLELDAKQLASAFVTLSIAIGIVMNAISTPLYRLLEGYAWPKKLRKWGVRRQRAHKTKLQSILDASPSGWERGLALERLARFPTHDNQIAPTQLGNALRAFETYGKTRFNLDSQTLWSELTTVVPKSLQGELDHSRAIVDFFVAMTYVSLGVALAGAAAQLLYGRDEPLLVTTVVALLATRFWYRMAITSSSYWSTTVQALVNLGRKPLAEQMGLELPKDIEDEREMWGSVTNFVYNNDDNSARRLERFRKTIPAARSH